MYCIRYPYPAAERPNTRLFPKLISIYRRVRFHLVQMLSPDIDWDKVLKYIVMGKDVDFVKIRGQVHVIVSKAWLDLIDPDQALPDWGPEFIEEYKRGFDNCPSVHDSTRGGQIDCFCSVPGQLIHTSCHKYPL
jgi:hypothetical protein